MVKKLAKPQKRFVCSNCGTQHPRWSGQCSDCGEWNSIAEDATAKSTAFSAKHDLFSCGTIIVMKPLHRLVVMPPARLCTVIGKVVSVLAAHGVPRIISQQLTQTTNN